jgi:uncharacterized protein
LPGFSNPDRILTMRIRSITCFIDPSYPIDPDKLKFAGEFINLARSAFIDIGYEVQSTRLASVPFGQLIPDMKPGTLARFASELESAALEQGFAYVSLGPALPHQQSSYQSIPEAIAETQNAFFAGSMTTLDGRVAMESIHQCAAVIQRTATISSDGFGNLRFAALANVPPGSPFFPAAYHHGSEPAFALATEGADLAVKAFGEATSLEDGRAHLVRSIEEHARKLTARAQKIEGQTGVKFAGIDFSLAPHPAEGISLGKSLEVLGVPRLGNFGSLAAAAFLADTMDRADFYRAGFSGLMLPVLEDATLAARAAEGSLDIKDLLLYSAVCGTGLDCIPLPGDTRTEQLFAVLLDVASLSTRLAKPLTARLMPIPGKKAGDPTRFNFAFFANSKVMSLSNEPLKGLLAGNELISLHPRNRG